MTGHVFKTYQPIIICHACATTLVTRDCTVVTCSQHTKGHGHTWLPQFCTQHLESYVSRATKQPGSQVFQTSSGSMQNYFKNNYTFQICKMQDCGGTHFLTLRLSSNKINLYDLYSNTCSPCTFDIILQSETRKQNTQASVTQSPTSSRLRRRTDCL